MPPIDLNPHDLEIVLAILRKFVPDCEVWAFGSRVKWTAKPFSDLDLAVIGEQPLPAGVAAELAEAFDESELPIKVDIVDWATTSDAFRQIIEREKAVVQQTSKGSAVSPAPTLLARNAMDRGSEWEIRPIALAPLEIIDGDRGVNYPKQEDFHLSGDCLFLNTGNVTSTGFNFSERSFITKEKDAALRKGKLKRHDVVLTTRGTVGNVALFDESIQFEQVRINSGMVLLRADQSRLLPKFLFQFVRSPIFREQVAALTTGSAQPQLPIRDIRQVDIPLPPPAEQKAIAMVLGGLDDKIELNRKQSAGLEQIASTIFNSWFVDFDPVFAKVEGCSPFGLDLKTAALFPAGFEGSDLGEIPAGWKATTLADIVTERTGKVGNDNGYAVLSAVASGELKRSDEHFTKQVYSQNTSKYKRVEQWDYAYNPSRINIGSIGMLEESIVGAVSPVYTVLRPAEGYEWFLRFFLDLPQTKEVINQFCSGSVRQSLSFKDFAAIPVVLPPKEIAEAFTRRWQELNGLRQKLAMQSSKLAEVRDTLLPKLMSGELRVPEELMA